MITWPTAVGAAAGLACQSRLRVTGHFNPARCREMTLAHESPPARRSPRGAAGLEVTRAPPKRTELPLGGQETPEETDLGNPQWRNAEARTPSSVPA